jgi:hypothetical protein
MKLSAKRLFIFGGLLIALLLIFSGTAWASAGQLGEAIGDGTIDLRLNRDVTGAGRLDVSNAQPGDSGSTVYPLENAGKAAGDLAITIPAINNIAAASGKYADGYGDLGAATETAFFIDMNMDGAWPEGDIGINASGNRYTAGALQYAPLNA